MDGIFCLLLLALFIEKIVLEVRDMKGDILSFIVCIVKK
jgi:hypothetical protein